MTSFRIAALLSLQIIATPAFGGGRTVQVIALGAERSPSRPDGQTELEPDANVSVPGTEVMRQHMQEAFRLFNPGKGTAEEAGGTYRDVPTRPSIPIPAWMRGVGIGPGLYAPLYGCERHPYRPAGFLHPSVEIRRARFYDLMADVACKFGLPVNLFDAMIIRESRYDHGARSPKGAFGLTQLMASTAGAMSVDRHDIVQNLLGGALYLRQQIERFGQVHLALAAYNAGPGNIRNTTMPRFPETQAYVGAVLNDWERLFRTQSGIYESRSNGNLAVQSKAGRETIVMTY